MTGKRTLMTFAAVAAAILVAGVASAASSPGRASLMIQHQLRGCHGWSLNGGAMKASQTVVLRRGGSITVVNDDVMPHKLIKTSGPAIQMRNLKTPFGSMGFHGTFGAGMMAHMGATTRVSFAHAGTYHFTTKAGEDYKAGVKTIGEDHVLRLTVKVA